MPTSPYMPAVVVEVAFDSGYTTPAASRTWTDVTDYVELSDGIDITYGRQDERSTAEANQCSLTLDNSDGRFTAERAASPYYPNVKVGRPIRVKATPVGGSEQVRFTGFVDEWPVAWDGTDAYASARITATSRLARLGLNTALRSVVEEEILYDKPTAYYTLGEPEGATSAADSSGNGAPTLIRRGSGAPVTFGSATGPGTDSLTAATFPGGGHLRGSGNLGTIRAMEAFVVTTTDLCIFVTISSDTTERNLGIWGGVARGSIAGVEVVSGGPTINDGALHHVLWVMVDPTLAGLYVDGVLVDSFSSIAEITPTEVRLGYNGGNTGTFPNDFAGSMAHVALYATAPPGVDRVADHATAGLTGFAGEGAASRLTRYTRWAGVETAGVDAAGATAVAHTDTTGAQTIELLRKVETAEDGVLHDDRDGVLTLRARADRYDASSAFTLDMASQHVGSDFQPKLDRSTLLNDATAANNEGTITARVVDTASRDEYGTASESLETLAQDPEAPHDLAAWRVGTYAEPRIRVPSLTVDILALASGGPPTPATILAADVGTLVTLSGQPSQAASSSSTYFVEGYAESIGGMSYSMIFNVSPSYPHTSVLILDDAIRGRLDQGNLLAH